MKEVCPICKRKAQTEFRPTSGDDIYHVSCPVCGTYEVTRTAALTTLGGEQPNYLISALVRNAQVGQKLSLSSKSIKSMLESARVPADPFETIDHLLQYIFSKAGGKASNYVKFDTKTDFPIVFADTPDELLYYLQKSQELGFIEPSRESYGYRLSLEGWRHLSKLRMQQRISNRAFVAMWFDPSLDTIWSQGFKIALEKTGFKPLRIDLSEHNEKICDRIVAEIRKSALLVADFTGQRGGVYFEAGYAMGLGIPVIWTCSQDHIKGLHFDTRQYNHIVWTDADDLKTKLINRIDATINKG